MPPHLTRLKCALKRYWRNPTNEPRVIRNTHVPAGGQGVQPESPQGLFWLILLSGTDTPEVSHARVLSGFTALPFVREDVCCFCLSSRAKVWHWSDDIGLTHVSSALSPWKRHSPQTHTTWEFACNKEGEVKAKAFGPIKAQKNTSSRGAPGDVDFSFHVVSSSLRTLIHQSRRATAAELPLLKHTDLVQQFYILGITPLFSFPANDQTSSLTVPDVWWGPVSGVLGSQLPVLAQKKTVQNSLGQLKARQEGLPPEWETQGCAGQTYLDFRRGSLTVSASGINLCKGKQLFLDMH